MVIPSHADLVAAIDAFLTRHPDIGEARFGRDATGEPGLVDRIRKGSSPTLRLLERITGYMARVDADHADADTTAPGASSAGIEDQLSPVVTHA